MFGNATNHLRDETRFPFLHARCDAPDHPKALTRTTRAFLFSSPSPPEVAPAPAAFLIRARFAVLLGAVILIAVGSSVAARSLHAESRVPQLLRDDTN